MPHQYTFPLVDPTFLIAGTQGLTVTHIKAFVVGSSGTGSQLIVSRVSSVVGGTPNNILPLDETAPACLAVSPYSPTSYIGGLNLGQFPVAAPALGVNLLEGAPIKLTPGAGLIFYISSIGSPSNALFNVYFEE